MINVIPYPEGLLGPVYLLPVLLVWTAGMIAVPLLSRNGDRGRTTGIMLGVVLQAFLAVVYIFFAWPLTRAFTAVLVTPFLGWAAEFIGSRTGIPFGRYHYTAALQPQIHRVPLAIPLAWLMMLPPSWAVAELIAPGSSIWIRATIAATAFTAWDIYLDPHLVHWSFWIWERPGRYYLGIPLTNFAGWFAWAWIITFVIRPESLWGTPFFLIYLATWLFQLGGHAVFWKMPVSAVAGFLAMGIPAAAAIRSLLSGGW